MSFVTRIAPAGAILVASLTTANAAPAQLYNKSIFIGMSVSIPGTGSDGSSSNRPRNINRIVYVSSAGRVFLKAIHSAGHNQEQKQRGPEDSGGAPRFQGNKLVGVIQFQSGATMMTVDFDPSFQSCTVNVVFGRDSGKPIVWKGLNGITYTSNGPPQIGGLSCSIRDGNALAS